MLRQPRIGVLSFVLLISGAGCAEPATPPPAVAPPPVVASAPPPASTAAVAPPPASTEAPAPPAPTAEDEKKAKAAKDLADDRAKWEEQRTKEQARWTPELHKDAKALAERVFPTGRAAIQAAVAGKQRHPGDAERDKYRHPVDTLDFFGFKPTLAVVEIGPGDGWYTELLAPALNARGKLFATTTDPNGPEGERNTFYGQRFKAFLDQAPEIYGKVQPVVIDGNAPKLGMDGTADLVLIMRGLHGMVNGGTLDTWLAEIHKALKPNGVLGIEEHRAKPDADVKESAKKGYVPEKWAIEKIEAAGFKLAGKAEINANAKDTKDYSEGVWTLPPTLRLGQVDREKYVAIGESDRMTLKFVKVEPKKTK